MKFKIIPKLCWILFPLVLGACTLTSIFKQPSQQPLNIPLDESVLEIPREEPEEQEFDLPEVNIVTDLYGEDALVLRIHRLGVVEMVNLTWEFQAEIPLILESGGLISGDGTGTLHAECQQEGVSTVGDYDVSYDVQGQIKEYPDCSLYLSINEIVLPTGEFQGEGNLDTGQVFPIQTFFGSLKHMGPYQFPYMVGSIGGVDEQATDLEGMIDWVNEFEVDALEHVEFSYGNCEYDIDPGTESP